MSSYEFKHQRSGGLEKSISKSPLDLSSERVLLVEKKGINIATLQHSPRQQDSILASKTMTNVTSRNSLHQELAENGDKKAVVSPSSLLSSQQEFFPFNCTTLGINGLTQQTYSSAWSREDLRQQLESQLQQQSVIRVPETHLKSTKLYQPSFIIKDRFRKFKDPLHKILGRKVSKVDRSPTSMEPKTLRISVGLDPLSNGGSGEISKIKLSGSLNLSCLLKQDSSTLAKDQSQEHDSPSLPASVLRKFESQT